MSEEHLEILGPKFLPPVCPYCKTELTEFREKHIVFKFGALVHVFWCPNEACRSLLSMQIIDAHPVGQQLPQVQIPPIGFDPSEFDPSKG